MYAVFVAALLSGAVASPIFDLNQVDYLQTKLSKGIAAVDEVFQDFKRIFNKKYEDEFEEKMRLDIFEVNVDYIKGHNKLYAIREKSYKLAVNQFTDLTHKEFLEFYTGYKPMYKSRNGSTFLPPSNINLPPEVDWRTKNRVTPVKNQEQCGSCWAFGTTGSLEGQYALKTGKLVSFSEQQLVDCSTENSGCNGGLTDRAFKYIEKAGGLETETDYPYTGKDGTCKFDPSQVVKDSKVMGYVDIQQGSESALQQAVATIGPISVAIDAAHRSFQSYSEGVYDEPDCSSSDLDHAVLAVGYGSYSGKDYWLVKNSWGTSWGKSGYILMSRNRENQCGIASEANYPRL